MLAGVKRSGVVLVLAVGWLAAASSPASAALVRGAAAEAAPGVQDVLVSIATAFERGDAEALAGLVHADGIRVRVGAGETRDTEYSPSQALFYFRNLFRSHRTVTFAWARSEPAPEGGRVHAMALWAYREPGGDQERQVRLVILLGRDGDAWRLSAITTIS